ncbi:hypothetical protein AB9K26_04840 [Psychroserpens sp. XS_ASV72]|uniref:hypothetical protein n=1 Tax=Psychroserpens sp. XS_ASV72 TaxID=3241293 RepID=UPI0035151F60
MKCLRNLMFLVCMPLLLMNTQCDDDDMQVSNCGQPAVIDSAFFDNAVSAEFNLVDFDLNDDCLTVEIGASGCDGSTWSLVLVDSGAVAESSPEQRFLKLVFTNDESCLAVFTQTRVFNLSNLRVEGSNQIVLHIEGLPESLDYMYP